VTRRRKRRVRLCFVATIPFSLSWELIQVTDSHDGSLEPSSFRFQLSTPAHCLPLFLISSNGQLVFDTLQRAVSTSSATSELSRYSQQCLSWTRGYGSPFLPPIVLFPPLTFPYLVDLSSSAVLRSAEKQSKCSTAEKRSRRGLFGPHS
jgi:hypothetical protein